MAGDATIEGIREVLEESLFDEIRRGVAPDLSVAELNARPAGGRHQI